MIRLFKQNTLAQVLIMALIVVVLWIRAFITPVVPQPTVCLAPLYELIYLCLYSSPRMASAIALLVVLVQGGWINRILTERKITKAHSLLPMMLYVIVMSWSNNFLTITPMLLVNIFLLAATGQLLSDGGTQLSTERNFNASFFVGMIALCYLPALYYIVPFVFVFIIYKMYRWRNIVVAIFGMIAPFIILFTYIFLCDKLDYYLILMSHDLSHFQLSLSTDTFASTLPTVVLLTLIAASLLLQLSSLSDRTIYQRINTGILSLPLLTAAILAFYPHQGLIDAQTLAMPFAFLGTRFFMLERKRQWISEVLLWVFLLAALLNILKQ
ncbi:MAG: hypothetical protein J6031_02920 [Bacteroidales bacterium]|nr:hypothetical protein [Bacteroidales bacterium]